MCEFKYDINIEINFIKHSMLDEPDRHKELYQYWSFLRPGLNQHVILFICLGYLSFLMGKYDQSEKDYAYATKLLSDKKISSVYEKYLKEFNNQPMMKDFKKKYGDKLQLNGPLHLDALYNEF
jgi:hypothetical protein